MNLFQPRFLFVTIMTMTVLFAKADIAMIQKNGLYILKCNHSGLPLRGAKPTFVCHVWKLYDDDTLSIQWLPNGNLLLYHYVDAWNGPKRFGLSRSKPAAGIWEVAPHFNAKMRRIAIGQLPVVSPNGRWIAYNIEISKGNVSTSSLLVEDMKSKKIIKVFTDSAESNYPAEAWTPDCREFIVSTYDSKDGFECRAVLYSFPKFRKIKNLCVSVNLGYLSVSPDGQYLAIESEMDGPVTGHFLIDLKSEKLKTIPSPQQFCDPLVYGWLPNSSELLCDWRTPDPKRDNSWTKDTMGLTNLRGSSFVYLGVGVDVQLSKSGKRFYYLNENKNWQLARKYRIFNLCIKASR